MSTVQQYRIGKRNYLFGLGWHVLSNVEPVPKQLITLCQEAGTQYGVLVGREKLSLAVGLADQQKKPSGYSAAASFAASVDNAIFVQSMEPLSGQAGMYWVVAVQDGVVLAGSDVVRTFDDAVLWVKRFSQIGAFQLLGDAAFYAEVFPESQRDGINDTVQVQSFADLVAILERKPIKITRVYNDGRKRNLTIALGVLVLALLVIGVWKYKQHAIMDAAQAVLSNKVQQWEAQLPIARQNMVRQMQDLLKAHTPQVLMTSIVEKIGAMDPFLNDWFITEVKCDVLSNSAISVQCRISWQNEGFGKNTDLQEHLAEQGGLLFVKDGKKATLNTHWLIAEKRAAITEEFNAKLPPEQVFLLQYGPRLQQLQSADIDVQMQDVKASEQFPPSPDGRAYTGIDTTFHYGKYMLRGNQYFQLHDVAKRLTEEYFSIDSVIIKFDNKQNCLGWQIEGSYVWK